MLATAADWRVGSTQRPVKQVLAEARGNGVGRSLMVHLIDEARSRTINRVCLSVELANHAVHLYASLGFTIIKEEHRAVTMVLEVQ